MGSLPDEVYWVWLASIPGIGARRFHDIIKYFEHPRNVWYSTDDEIARCCFRLGESVACNIIARKKEEYLEEAARLLKHPGISVITLEDPEYPVLLRSIYDPPPVLYCKGKLPQSDRPAVAIVGSRKTSGYGRKIAEKLAYELAQAGVTIVSGLARGIDTMAHKGALRAGGYTIGVLGCGIDVVYPPENRKLFLEMEEKGTILSEYPPGVRPFPGNFPARNRIISGLAQATLVVEAGRRSGALITADLALEQGRDVFAVPGNIDSPHSEGTNNLLKEGAKVITCAEDVLEELGVNKRESRRSPGRADFQLDFFESQVCDALEDGEKQFEELVRITGIEAGRLGAIVTSLEIRGIIKQLPGRIFIKQ